MGGVSVLLSLPKSWELCRFAERPGFARHALGTCKLRQEGRELLALMAQGILYYLKLKSWILLALPHPQARDDSSECYQ